MGKKPVINLRVYRGKELDYDAVGNVKNENQSVKVIYDTVEWMNFMKYLPYNGYCKVEVQSVIIDKSENQPSSKDIEAIKKEVEQSLNPTKAVELTDDQKRIADLEAKLDKLVGGTSEKKVELIEDDLSDVRSEYEKVFDKKPFHKWTVSQLKEKIENA